MKKRKLSHFDAVTTPCRFAPEQRAGLNALGRVLGLTRSQVIRLAADRLIAEHAALICNPTEGHHHAH